MRSVRDARGLTLLELLVVIMIVGVVMLVSNRMITATTLAFSRETTSASLIADMAAAKNILLDDLSVAGYLKTPSTTFISATRGTNADAVTFEGDVDSDGTLDRVCYRLNAGSVERARVAAGTACANADYESLVSGVSGFTLRFFDRTRTEITNVGLITAGAEATGARYVSVRIELQGAAKGGTITKFITGETALRNFG